MSLICQGIALIINSSYRQFSNPPSGNLLGSTHDITITKRRDNVAEFYLDGVFSGTLTAPVEGGKVIINHWSNGDGQWSGTPSVDTTVVVESVLFYYD